MRHRHFQRCGLLLVALVPLSFVLGETRAPSSTPPRLSFELMAELALPGPLPEGGVRRVERGVEIIVAGGLATASWENGPPSAVTIEARAPGAPAVEPTPWSESPDGRVRARTTPDGQVVAQKRCRRCRKGWRKLWKLSVAGDRLAPPLVTEKAVYFGALDNHVYAVRRRSGFRVWLHDVQDRVVRPLMRWRAELPVGAQGRPHRVEAILVLPGDGSGMLALEAATGTVLARFDLPNDGSSLKGVPVTAPQGEIVVAREGYNVSEASLMVFRLQPASPAPEEDERDQEPAKSKPQS